MAQQQQGLLADIVQGAVAAAVQQPQTIAQAVESFFGALGNVQANPPALVVDDIKLEPTLLHFHPTPLPPAPASAAAASALTTSVGEEEDDAFSLWKALFWIQNTQCYANLRAEDIEASPLLTTQFARVVKLFRTELRFHAKVVLLTREQEWKELRAWWSQPQNIDACVRLNGASSVVNPLQQPGASAVEKWARPPKPADEDKLWAARDSVWNTHIRLVCARINPATTLPRPYLTRLHARVQFADLLRIEWFLDNERRMSTAQHTYLRGRADTLRTWLRAFAAHGCACSS